MVRERTNLRCGGSSDNRGPAPEADGREIEWRIESLPEVECDSGLLKLVFSNLLSNAAKFTRARQRAVIEIGTCLPTVPWRSLCGITEWASIRNTPINSLGYSSGFTARKTSRGPASDWLPCNESFIVTGARSGPNPSQDAVLPSSSRWRTGSGRRRHQTERER